MRLEKTLAQGCALIWGNLNSGSEEVPQRKERTREQT